MALGSGDLLLRGDLLLLRGDLLLLRGDLLLLQVTLLELQAGLHDRCAEAEEELTGPRLRHRQAWA